MRDPRKINLRQEIRSYLESIADSVEEKSRLIFERLMGINAFQQAQLTKRLMGFVSMPLEVNTSPILGNDSVIVPFCRANEIVPIRICSLDELELSGSIKIWIPKLSVRLDTARQVRLEQIDVVLVPGLAFDRFGNRLGRGRGYYDRFLRRLPANVLTIGLAFDGMIREQVFHDAHDQPVKMVVTESRGWVPF